MNEIKNCPFCNDDDIVYAKKQSLWICQACDKTFSNDAPPGVVRLTGKATAPKAIFFSYGHDDHQELVQKFKTDLEKRGHTVWFDAKDIGAWDDWKGKITRGIVGSQMAIAFMSKHALRDPGVCRNEIAIALGHFGVIYPVAVEANIHDDIPVTIRHLQWPELHDWQAIRDGKIPGKDWKRWYEERFIELVNKIEGEATRFSGETEVLREVLRPSAFEAKFTQHLQGFVGRQWVFEAYQDWLEHRPQSRLFWIKAGPGFGKTALAVNLAARERGAIVAHWFCDSGSAELTNPAQAVRTLAYQWALRWEDFRVKLLRQLGISANTPTDLLDNMREELNKHSPQDLFRTLLIEPLSNLIWREHKLVVVIDALDEATNDQGNNPLADFLGSQMASLPEWISFVVTCRPDLAIVSRLQGFKPFSIDAQDERNLADLQEWYAQNLSKQENIAQLPEPKQQVLAKMLLERSEGMILYLKLIEEGLKEQSLTVDQLDKLESGLPGLYANYAIRFQHRFGKDYATNIQPLARLLVAAAGPLPEDLACAALGWNSEQFNQARLSLGSYAIDSHAGISLFHKTLREWLIRKADHSFYVDPDLGRQQIADVFFKEIDKDSHRVRWREPIRQWLTAWWPTLVQKTDANALNTLGSRLLDWADYAQAEPLYREALALWKTALPAGHPDIATSLNNLAYLLQATGRFDEAEPLYREALALRQTALPAGHPDIATSLNNLAGLLRTIGRFDEAEPLYREALALWKTALPAGHPDIATSLNNLAGLLRTIGRFDEAEPLYREALALWKTALPAGHPDIATSLNNLAGLLEATGRFDEAEPLYREALALRQTALPAGHPDIATSLNNLAGLLRTIGRFDEAEPLYREALALWKTALPAGHPDIATSLNNLAYLLQATGRFDEAEPLYREALALWKTALPAGHPDIATSLNNLAYLLQATGRFDEAEPLYREALALRQAALPADHPDIAASLNNLAGLLEATGRFDEAESLYREALALRQTALPAGHPDIATSLNNLAGLLEATGRFDEAEPLYREALALRQTALPAGHPDIATSLNNLAYLLQATGRFDEAEPLYREALALRQTALPAGHPDIATSLNNLAGLLRTIGRFDEAEPLYREALALRQTALPAGHPDIATSLNNLAVLFYTTGRFDEAAPLFLEAIQILGPEHPNSVQVLKLMEHVSQERAQP